MLQLLVATAGQDFDKAYEHFMALSNWTMYVADYINHLRTVQPRCLDMDYSHVMPCPNGWWVASCNTFWTFLWRVDVEEMDD